jgi:hypothetical protein
MTTTTKDNIELIAANGGAVGLSLTEINEGLITVSIILAIFVSLAKLVRKKK